MGVKVCIGEEMEFGDFQRLTKGRHEKPINIQNGMPNYAILKRGASEGSSPRDLVPLQGGGGEYEDVIEPARGNKVGYAMYYGDNGWKEGDKPPRPSADTSHGIRLLNRVQDLYFSDERAERAVAPPILISQNFKRRTVSMRRFMGIGVLIGREIVMLEDRGVEYENVLYHVALLELPDCLDWDWVDSLRDPLMSVEETLEMAPESWRRWVEDGNAAISDGPIERSLEYGQDRPPRAPDPLTVAEEKEEDDGTGEVYAITNRAWPGYVKIGRAKLAEQRVRDYQTYSPKRDYELRHRVHCDDRISSENRAHKKAGLLALGRKGEWFKISLDQAKEVLDQVGDA